MAQRLREQTGATNAQTDDRIIRREGDRVRPDREMRARQREQYGGFKFGAVFFGWVVAVGIGVLLTSILSATGAAIGLTDADTSEISGQDAQTIGIVGGVLLLMFLAIAYYAGGYVAGRLARFDGGRQGLGVWLFALAVALVLAAAGAVLGAEYNVLDQLNVVPRLPDDAGSLTIGGLIVLAVVLVVTLVAATLGGKLGEQFHHKVDRAGL
jgi:hypothetical protein